MIKQITVCVCDVCGKMEKPKFDGHYAAPYVKPDGWGGGPNGNIDVCPECSTKINAQSQKDYSGFAKQIK